MVVDTGEKHADGKSVIAHRYGFHSLRHAAASLFIQHLKWPPSEFRPSWATRECEWPSISTATSDIEKDRADIATIEAAIRAAWVLDATQTPHREKYLCKIKCSRRFCKPLVGSSNLSPAPARLTIVVRDPPAFLNIAWPPEGALPASFDPSTGRTRTCKKPP